MISGFLFHRATSVNLGISKIFDIKAIQFRAGLDLSFRKGDRNNNLISFNRLEDRNGLIIEYKSSRKSRGVRELGELSLNQIKVTFKNDASFFSLKSIRKLSGLHEHAFNLVI